jgi:two-component sensor histidine kinase
MNTQDKKKQQFEKNPEGSGIDLIIICILSVIVFIISHTYNFFDTLIDYFGRHENKKIDDILTVTIFLAFALIYYVIRRFLEIRKKNKTIQKLLGENELILKEVHHRIKNNMNTICGLLALQGETLNDSSAKTVLQDAENRVQSMMLLYDKLYKSNVFTEISVSEYLPFLIDEIIANFPNGKSVSVVKNIESFSLDIRRLQPLGIIINELLTNIMKYAFTGRTDRIIAILAKTENRHVTVTIEDNGNGMPETVDFEKSTGFGLILVKGLTKQIDGKIKIIRRKGTQIMLEFPI